MNMTDAPECTESTLEIGIEAQAAGSATFYPTVNNEECYGIQHIHDHATDSMSPVEQETTRSIDYNVKQLAFYHGGLTETNAEQRLQHGGDYLLRHDPSSGKLILSVKQTRRKHHMPKFIHHVLVKTEQVGGDAYRLPKRPHARTVRAYIDYFKCYHIPVISNAFLTRAVICERQLHCSQRPPELEEGGVDFAHGVLTPIEAQRRCLAGDVGDFLLWTDSRDDSAVLAINTGDEGVVNVVLPLTADEHSFQLPNGDVVTTERQFVQHFLRCGTPLFANIYVKRPITAPPSSPQPTNAQPFHNRQEQMPTLVA